MVSHASKLDRFRMRSTIIDYRAAIPPLRIAHCDLRIIDVCNSYIIRPMPDRCKRFAEDLYNFINRNSTIKRFLIVLNKQNCRKHAQGSRLLLLVGFQNILGGTALRDPQVHCLLLDELVRGILVHADIAHKRPLRTVDNPLVEQLRL